MFEDIQYLPAIVLIIALFLLLSHILTIALIHKKILSVLWCTSASLTSVIVIIFFSFWNHDPAGNIFALGIMIHMLCYSLLGASLSLSINQNHLKR